MERSKREANSIIIKVVFYFVLILILIYYTFYSLLPQINQIEQDKQSTKEIQANLSRIQKQGLSFDEFKINSNTGEQKRYVTEILKSMKQDFYTDYLVNKNFSTYNEFLENKKTELSDSENTFVINDKSDKISKVLPPYSDESIGLGDNLLTDYKFINYIESVIETFNLSINNSIGIGKLVLLDEFAISNKTGGNALDSNIFYIPLSLTINGTKSSIIDFLYYIENVGNITVDNNDISINNNYEFLSKNGIKKVLEGERLTSDYNIFEHQIIDIENISMYEYIDGSYNFRGKENLVDFINRTQGNNDFTVKVDLMFFVKGQPAYKIEEYILGVFNKQSELLGLISQELKNTDLKSNERTILTNNNNLVKEFSKEIQVLRKSLGDKEKLEETYKKAVKIDEIINPIYTNLKK